MKIVFIKKGLYLDNKFVFVVNVYFMDILKDNWFVYNFKIEVNGLDIVGFVDFDSL